MDDRAKAIFLTAGTYSKAARHINAAVLNDLSQLLPSQVIAALAIELYFIEKNTNFKINGKHSHDFNALFRDLSVDSRNNMEQSFQELMTERDMQDVHAIESQSKVKVPRDLAGNLKCWSDVFTKVRYMYDKPNEAKSMMFFPEIEQAVTNVIFGIRPEFLS